MATCGYVWERMRSISDICDGRREVSAGFFSQVSTKLLLRQEREGERLTHNS